jgi:uncharacterized protein YrrD
MYPKVSPFMLPLQDTKLLYGRKLEATDGELGHVKDFYFDDKTWEVRYLVVDTGFWLSGRLVLLSSHAFGSAALGVSDTDNEVLKVNLTRKQIEDSPACDAHEPVSRQYEEEYHRYYGWPAYWQYGGVWGIAGPPGLTPPQTGSLPAQGDDIHLRSMKAVTGYRIRATDGEIGSVSSFMLDSERWAIGELAVDAGHWYAGKTILLLPENIDRISYEDSTVFVNLTKKDINETARDDIAHAKTAISER